MVDAIIGVGLLKVSSVGLLSVYVDDSRRTFSARGREHLVLKNAMLKSDDKCRD